MSLRAILDHLEAVPSSQIDDRVEVGRRAVQMHRNDGFSARRDCAFDPLWIDCVRDGIDIDQHRRRARQFDGGDGGDGRVRHGDDLVALAEAAGADGNVQRFRA